MHSRKHSKLQIPKFQETCIVFSLNGIHMLFKTQYFGAKKSIFLSFWDYFQAYSARKKYNFHLHIFLHFILYSYWTQSTKTVKKTRMLELMQTIRRQWEMAGHMWENRFGSWPDLKPKEVGPRVGNTYEEKGSLPKTQICKAGCWEGCSTMGVPLPFSLVSQGWVEGRFEVQETSQVQSKQNFGTSHFYLPSNFLPSSVKKEKSVSSFTHLIPSSEATTVNSLVYILPDNFIYTPFFHEEVIIFLKVSCFSHSSSTIPQAFFFFF